MWQFAEKGCFSGNYHATFGEFKVSIGGGIGDLSRNHRAAINTLITGHFQSFDGQTSSAA
jgi:hypothetical protein